MAFANLLFTNFRSKYSLHLGCKLNGSNTDYVHRNKQNKRPTSILSSVSPITTIVNLRAKRNIYETGLTKQMCE